MIAAGAWVSGLLQCGQLLHEWLWQGGALNVHAKHVLINSMGTPRGDSVGKYLGYVCVKLKEPRYLICRDIWEQTNFLAYFQITAWTSAYCISSLRVFLQWAGKKYSHSSYFLGLLWRLYNDSSERVLSIVLSHSKIQLILAIVKWPVKANGKWKKNITHVCVKSPWFLHYSHLCISEEEYIFLPIAKETEDMGGDGCVN